MHLIGSDTDLRIGVKGMKWIKCDGDRNIPDGEVFSSPVKTGAISQLTPVAGAYPLVAALLGWWVLREPLTPTRALGALCVVMGVILLRK